MPFRWLTQPFHAPRFVMHKDPEMLVFSKATNVTDASLLLGSLKKNIPFLKDGLGNIIVTQVKYCKCRRTKGSPWEHEFLLVTLKESVGARRTAFLLVEQLMDDTKGYTGGQEELLANIAKRQSEEMIDIEATDSKSIAESESIALRAEQQRTTSSRVQRSDAKFKSFTKGDPPDALDRLIILPNRRAIARELGHSPFDILMTMDLNQSQNHRSVSLEHFARLLRTTSRNTAQYPYIFAQCYWYAFTIWKVLEIETQPRIRRLSTAGRQGSYLGHVVLGKGESVNTATSPEVIKAQWEAERTAEDEEWAEKKQALVTHRFWLTNLALLYANYCTYTSRVP